MKTTFFGLTNLICLICIMLGGNLSAQIFSNSITGSGPGNSNPFTNGQIVSSNATATGIGRFGVTGNSANDRYNTVNWPETEDLNKYFTFTMAPKEYYELNFTSLSFNIQRSNTGPTNFALRSSLNGYSTDLETWINTANGTPELISINLSTNEAFQHIKYPNEITFRIYAWNASSGSGTASVNDFSFDGAVLLPIELLSFAHNIFKNQIHLLWSTATELNNDYMAIERSVDGQNFSEIGRVPGAGNSLERIDYSFIDRFPYQGTNYYRLRQVDFDGSSTYHKVIAVDFKGESENTLAINQSLEEVSVQFHSPNAAGQLVLVDAMGRIIRTQKIAEKVQSARINTNGLPKGFYVVQIHQKDGLTKAMPLIK